MGLRIYGDGGGYVDVNAPVFSGSASVTLPQSGTLVVKENPIFSSPTIFPSGSATTPSISASGDTNTGIFFPASDTVAIATNGSEKIRIDSNGNIGIGISSTNIKFEVYGGNWKLGTKSGGAYSGGLGGGLNESNNIYSLYFRDRTDTNWNTAFIEAKDIYLKTNNGETTTLLLNTTNQVCVPDGSSSLPSFTNIGDENTGIYFPANDNIAISTGGTQRFNIDSDGNIGIELFKSGSGSQGRYLNLRPSLGPGYEYNCSISAYDHSGDTNTDGITISGADGISFCSGSNSRQERMRINSLGKVGILTTNPAYGLHIQGSDSNALMIERVANDTSTTNNYTRGIHIRSGASNLNIGVAGSTYADTSWTNKSWIVASGQLAFGTGGNVPNTMVIDTVGRVTTPSQPRAEYAYEGGLSVNTHPILFNVVHTNVGNNYNSTNGRFTAPVNGYYQIVFSGLIYTDAYISFVINGGEVKTIHRGASGGATSSMTLLRYLNANDYITFAFNTLSSGVLHYSHFYNNVVVELVG